MPKTAVPRKPESLARKADETRLTSRNRSLASLIGIGDSERQLARDFGSGLNDVIGRGTLAGLIGLPGDLGGMAENGIRGLIGLPQVEPFGGSEHIGRKLEEYGLVSPERRPVTEMVAGMISPGQLASASYRAPQMARAGTTALERLMTRSTMGGVNRPAGQTGAIENLWHGSPHTFDRFDLNNAEGGTGGQLYGHGVYLSDSQDVAKGYRAHNSATARMAYGGKPIKDEIRRSVAWDLDQSGYDKEAVKAKWMEMYKPSMWERSLGKKMLRELDRINPEKINAGQLYQAKVAWPDAREVSDPLGPDHFLHWDKPLSEQSQYVQDALSNSGILEDSRKSGGFYKSDIESGLMNGRHIVNPGRYGNPAESARLMDAGIPGIRYLDQGSRGAADGTHNYVVFDDRLIDIVSRNGQPVSTLGRMVAPQDEALRIAQQNAAKPVSDGGLGLRPDNTPEERAAAMGFDIDNPMAHGTNKPNITEFKVGKGGVDEIGAGVYAAPIDSRPFGYTYSNAWAQGKKAVNYPIVVKNDLADYDSIRRGLSTPLYKMPDGTPISPMSDDEASLIQRIVDKEPGWADDIPLLREHIRQMDASSVIKKAGYAGAKSVDSQVPGQVLTFDPKNIRSRFAAFDPFRRNEADIMAGFAPVGIGAYLYGQQDEP